MGKLKRRPDALEQRKRFFIVCEGRVTEPKYLSVILRARETKDGEITIRRPPPNTPKGMVESALDWKKKGLGGRKKATKLDVKDEAWCVFDVEAKVSQTARPGLAEALKMAKVNKISIALSNPCFELWVLLHYENCNAWTYSDDVQHRCSELRLVDEKHIQNPDELLKKYPSARRRAENLDAQHQRNGTIKEADQNPSSGVYKLIDAIYAAFPART